MAARIRARRISPGPARRYPIIKVPMTCISLGARASLWIRFRTRLLWFAALALCAWGPGTAWGAEPVPVTLQLKWFHQFQFAGYYAAQLKGFYRAEGLDVTLLEANPRQVPMPMVESGRAQFGVSDLEVFQAYLEGRPLVALGVIFQHSPNVIIALRRSGIQRPSDLAGRTVMFQSGQGLTEIQAMLGLEGLRLDSIRQLPHSWTLDDLLQGRVEAITGYATNEPYAPPVSARRAWLRVVWLALPAALLLGLVTVVWITLLRRTVRSRTRALREEVRQRQQTGQALEASEARYRSILNASPDSISITDLEGKLLMVSPMTLTLWRVASEEDLLGRRLTDFIDPGDRDRAAGNIGLMFQGIMRGPEAYTGLRPDGTRFAIEANAEFIRDGQGQPTHLVLVVRDISERRRMEEERHQLQAQLQQVQKMESLGSLAGGVAHDMNNVLGAILGMASLHGEQAPPGSDLQQGLATITKAAERGGKMVQSLLSLARVSPAELLELDMNLILREEALLLEHTALAPIRLELELAPGLRLIRGDPGALAHAIMNLCVNAADAMAGSGTLRLRTRNLESGGIEVEVQDTGCGMSRELMAKAMNPFFTTKPVGKGTGLGLSLVFSTVKAHQGQLELHSEPGRGTRVTLRFPAAAPAGPDAAPAQSRPVPARTGLKVLLVDDDRLVLDAVLAMAAMLGHAVTAAASGEEALERLEACAPDVVILDLNMPGLGGTGTLPRLRARRPELPILLATGRADQDALELVAAFPGVTLLAKPFGMRELQRQLERV